MAGFFSSKDTPKQKNQIGIPQCGKCGLSKKCISPKMKPTGKGKRKILFVAEAPGEQEDRRGTQLVGEAGQLLRDVLDEVGIDLEDCWKTNSVICRPPKNKIEPYMISSCRPNLFKTIKALKPKVIIILGASALESILYHEWKKNIGTLARWVGWGIPSAVHNAWLCPTYHPSYLLRMGENEILMTIFKDHLKRALKLEKKELNYYTLSDLESQVEVVTNPAKAKYLMKKLADTKGILAFDYETTGLKPEREEQRIISVSFCINGKKTFACKLTDELKPLLSKILKSPKLKKVASNMKFEERWTMAKLGHKVRAWHWDTMLAAHALDNRKHVTSIKFQAFVQLGIADYDSHISPNLYSKYPNGINRIDQLRTDDLLLYNGLDSLLEYLVMKKQKEIFDATG